MKVLAKDGLSLYLFDASEFLELAVNNITVGKPPKFIIGDCNLSNSVIYEGVEAPQDWVGGKYLFDGEVWEIDPNWIDPEADVVEEVI